LTAKEYDFANYLKNQKNLDPQKVTNNFAELKEEYNSLT